MSKEILLLAQHLSFREWLDMNRSDKETNKSSNNKDKSALKRRKCLYHPAMKCPTPREPCIFALLEKSEKRAVASAGS
jgi:hypothetical protein